MISNRITKDKTDKTDKTGKGVPSKYLDELNAYFRLKQKYEKKLDDEKQSIIKNSDLTPREKRQKYQQNRVRCVNCRQTGGTIFSQKRNVYSAVCGNTTKPCNLKINIVRQERQLLPELIQKYSQK